MESKHLAAALLVLPLFAGPARQGAAQQPAAGLPAASPASGAEAAAFLFTYHIKPGMQAAFDEGYRRHLSWHQGKKDTLVWYAWYVTSGDRTGLFIDGSFGAPFAAFDQRVEPPADAADFAQTAAPFSEPAARITYRLRPDLSTGQLLEDLRPSPIVQVTHYTLHPGMEGRFENFAARLRTALARSPGAPVHTWYELVVGGDAPGYLLMVPRQQWGDFGGAQPAIGALLEHAYGTAQARQLLAALAASVARASSEMWTYRKDLSYFPPWPPRPQ
jgi:hypothetical protein